MKLLTDIDSINRQQWLALVDRSPVASIFQTPAMYDFYQSLQLYTTSIYAIEEAGMLKGVVLCLIQKEGRGIKGRLTSRAIINGGPLLDSSISPKALQTLLNATIEHLSHRCIYIETRNLNDYSPWRDTFEQCGFSYESHYNFHIDTSDPSLADKRIDKSRRRRIRRATEAGATISQDTAHLPVFYNILSDLYRTKIHKPLPPYTLFERLASTSFSHYFFILDPQGEVIGGQLILTLDHQVAYAWYCCGLDHEYHDLYPSIMANYAAIRYATDNRFVRYDMMGAGKPGEDYGVREFKAQFGGALVEHGRFLHVNNKPLFFAGKVALKLLGTIKK
ncbi:MAG: peptidoglycan bridge formation glycyltransferase FemA/FemB family protein [Bacteroidales bacterium]|nr:peptidoglycan bridge formation glycyltransferase FemA/FemB family protein [Bacteroidales bacterium]